MKSFNTDYLENFPGDWECVEDFCGRSSCFGYSETMDVTAWYSSTLGVTKFGGDWYDVPDLDFKPTSSECWDHALHSDSYYGNRARAAMKRKQARELSNEKLTNHYKENGYNWITVSFLNAETKEVVTLSECCGIRNTLHMLPITIQWMLKNLPEKSTLQKLVMEEGIMEKDVEKRVKTHISKKVA